MSLERSVALGKPRQGFVSISFGDLMSLEHTGIFVTQIPSEFQSPLEI